jgi:hypothetical protein
MYWYRLQIKRDLKGEKKISRLTITRRKVTRLARWGDMTR